MNIATTTNGRDIYPNMEISVFYQGYLVNGVIGQIWDCKEKMTIMLDEESTKLIGDYIITVPIQK